MAHYPRCLINSCHYTYYRPPNSRGVGASLRITFLTSQRPSGIDASMGRDSTSIESSLTAEKADMSLRKLAKFALYALQASLAIGAIWIGIAILGGMFYLQDASKIDYADMRSEIFTILRNESILVGVGTTFLFGIGIVRTFMARNREAERRKGSISILERPALDPYRSSGRQT